MTNEEEPALLVSSSDGGDDDDDARRRRNNDTTTAVKPIDGKYIKIHSTFTCCERTTPTRIFSLRFCHRETLRGWEFQRSSNGEV